MKPEKINIYQEKFDNAFFQCSLHQNVSNVCDRFLLNVVFGYVEEVQTAIAQSIYRSKLIGTSVPYWYAR